MTELTRIANKHNTDKGTVAYEAHGYTEEYSKYIPSKGHYNLLEIGVWHGDSVKMWREYNPDMNIRAVDIDESCLKWLDSSFHPCIYIGDATNPVFMKEIIDAHENPDFIVDDGSHRCDDIIKAFDILYPHLKCGGYYFIEDLHASYAERDRVLEYTAPYNGQLVCNDKLLIIKKP